ncbi:uncharacterized protein RMCN_5105, partial [Mycolicibacterium novocastrense]
MPAAGLPLLPVSLAAWVKGVVSPLNPESGAPKPGIPPPPIGIPPLIGMAP